MKRFLLILLLNGILAPNVLLGSTARKAAVKGLGEEVRKIEGLFPKIVGFAQERPTEIEIAAFSAQCEEVMRALSALYPSDKRGTTRNHAEVVKHLRKYKKHIKVICKGKLTKTFQRYFDVFQDRIRSCSNLISALKSRQMKKHKLDSLARQVRELRRQLAMALSGRKGSSQEDVPKLKATLQTTKAHLRETQGKLKITRQENARLRSRVRSLEDAEAVRQESEKDFWRQGLSPVKSSPHKAKRGRREASSSEEASSLTGSFDNSDDLTGGGLATGEMSIEEWAAFIDLEHSFGAAAPDPSSRARTTTTLSLTRTTSYGDSRDAGLDF